MNKYFKAAVRLYSVTRSTTGAAVHDHVWATIGDHGDRTAISCPETGRSLTYDRLRKLSGNLASWLHYNTPWGQQLATVLPNSLELAISALGALEAGVPLSPLNPLSTSQEMAGFFSLSNPKWLITTSNKIPDILEAMKAVNRTPSETGIVAIDEEIIFSGIHFFDELLQESGSFERYTDQPALYMFGADEVSKVSQKNILANCIQVSGPELSPLLPGDKSAAALPMFNNYGLTHTLLRPLASGAEVVTINSTKPDNLIAMIHKNKVRVLPTVSPMADVLASFGREALSGLKSITVGGRPTIGSGKLKNIFGGEVLHNYGPIEGPVLFQQRRGVGGRSGSVGQPLPGTDARIIAPGGVDLPEMTEGEIWIRGPQLGTNGDWIRTGDLGYADPDGWYYVTVEGGMSNEGLKVFPVEMENVLKTHKGVSQAAVFTNGRNLVAAVVPSDYYNPPTLRVLSQHLEVYLSPHKRISDVVIMSSLPKTDKGQFDRLNLSENYNPHHNEYAVLQSV